MVCDEYMHGWHAIHSTTEIIYMNKGAAFFLRLVLKIRLLMRTNMDVALMREDERERGVMGDMTDEYEMVI